MLIVDLVATSRKRTLSELSSYVMMLIAVSKSSHATMVLWLAPWLYQDVFRIRSQLGL